MCIVIWSLWVTAVLSLFVAILVFIELSLVTFLLPLCWISIRPTKPEPVGDYLAVYNAWHSSLGVVVTILQARNRVGED
jgi:hypothetical protein